MTRQDDRHEPLETLEDPTAGDRESRIDLPYKAQVTDDLEIEVRI